MTGYVIFMRILFTTTSAASISKSNDAGSDNMWEHFRTVILISILSAGMSADKYTKQLAPDHFKSQAETSVDIFSQ
jgi:hypothetical protein